MRFYTFWVILLMIPILAVNSESQAQTTLTADDIVNHSIRFSGGVRNLARIQSSSLTYMLILPDTSHAGLILKRETGKKYMQSMMSPKYAPTASYFDGSIYTSIEDESKRIITDVSAIEEVRLLTYNLPQYGYQQLGYRLERLDDQKFSHFDCYVVSATASNGYQTLNFFDKTNCRLLMTSYPRGNKSVMMEYDFKDSVLVNTTVMSISEKHEQTLWKLLQIKNNFAINSLWFQPGKDKSTAVPADIRKGSFTASNGSVLTRTDQMQSEQAPNFQTTLPLHWLNNYQYIMVMGTQEEKPSPILVKIVGWNADGYVCHYYTDRATGTEEYHKRK